MIPEFAMPGDKMVFLNQNGYEEQRERALAEFGNKVLTVSAIDVGSSMSYYQFVGYDKKHNSVMFDFADIDAILAETADQREARRKAYSKAFRDNYYHGTRVLGSAPPEYPLPMRPLSSLLTP